MRAADAIAAIAQNNPACQTLLEGRIVPRLAHMLAHEREAAVVAKCVRCLSCLARESPALSKELADCGGGALLANTLRDCSDDAVAVKVCFTLRHQAHVPAIVGAPRVRACRVSRTQAELSMRVC